VNKATPHRNYSAKLDGCLLGKNTQVGMKAELVRCVTQAGYEVNAGGEYYMLGSALFADGSKFVEVVKGEKLEVSDWMATPDIGATQEEDSD